MSQYLSTLGYFLFFLSQDITGSKVGSYKDGLIANTPHHKETNETEVAGVIILESFAVKTM